MASRIPEKYWPGFKALMSLDDESRQQLFLALDEANPTLDIKGYADQIGSKVRKISQADIGQIIITIVSLYIRLDRRGEAVEELIADLLEAIRSTESLAALAAHNLDEFGQYLKRLLVLNGKLSIVSKAAGILSDHERAYCDSRILTDIRPVFGSDITVTPSASLIVHMLKIGYHEGGVHKEFYVALDTADIRELQEVLDRASEKAETLKDFIAKTDLLYLEPE